MHRQKITEKTNNILATAKKHTRTYTPIDLFGKDVLKQEVPETKKKQFGIQRSDHRILPPMLKKKKTMFDFSLRLASHQNEYKHLHCRSTRKQQHKIDFECSFLIIDIVLIWTGKGHVFRRFFYVYFYFVSQSFEFQHTKYKYIYILIHQSIERDRSILTNWRTSCNCNWRSPTKSVFDRFSIQPDLLVPFVIPWPSSCRNIDLLSSHYRPLWI